MKTILIILVLSYSIISRSQNVNLYEPFNYKQAVENGTRSRDGNPGPKYWQNYADYKIEVTLDTVNKKIIGEELVTYFNQSPDTLRSVVIRLYKNRYKKDAFRNMSVNPDNISKGVVLDTLNINRVGIQLKSSDIHFVGTNMRIKLQDSIPPNDSLKLFCKWEYNIPLSESFRRSGYYKDNAYFIGYFYPQIAVYDDMEHFFHHKGWDYRLFHQGINEFYNDFNNYDVTINVPESHYVWATGSLINSEEVYGTEVLSKVKKASVSDSIIHIISLNDSLNNFLIGNKWNYVARKVPDFAFGVATNYLWDATSLKVEDKRVFIDVAYHPKSELYSMAIDIAKQGIKYASEISPAIHFPYECSTTFNGMYGGGMEFPMIANNCNMEDSMIMRNITFHEIFHNYVPFSLGFNEKRYQFMDEGITTLITDLFTQDNYGKKSYSKFRENGLWGFYEMFAKNKDLPLIDSYASMDEYDISYFYYVKSFLAYYIFMEMVGRDNFMVALQQFANRWRGKHPTPYDFFYTMNNVLKENFNWYWKAWFFEYGYADLGVEFKDKRIVVKRIGEGSLPVPIHLIIEYDDDSKKTITRTAKIWKDGNSEVSFKVSKPSLIKKITLDNSNSPDIDSSNNEIVL